MSNHFIPKTMSRIGLPFPWNLALAALVLFFFGAQFEAGAYVATNAISGPEDTNNQDDNDDNCDPPTANDGPQGDSPCGMPEWRVSEPFINLWLHDTPLRYRLSSGKWMELKLSYKHRVEWEDRRAGIGGFGEKWECNWIGLLEANDGPFLTNYLAGGGMSVFATAGTPEYRSGRRMTLDSGGGGVVYNIETPTGSQNQYDTAYTGSLGWEYKLRSKQFDRYGRQTTFEWETDANGARLIRVRDRDGRACVLGYTNANPNLITSVTDPYGRSAYFIYNHQGLLTNIIDMADMPSAIAYDENHWVTNLTTLYGTNRFRYFDSTNATQNIFLPDRAIEITEADGSKQLYAYREHASATNDNLVTYAAGTFASNDQDYRTRNSFHWDRKQYAALSGAAQTDPLNLPIEDYWKASVQHWLVQNLIGYTMLSDTPSDSAGPVLQPQVNDSRSRQTHYDYQNQTAPNYVGTQKRLTSVVNNGVSFSSGLTTAIDIGRNDWGRPTSVTYQNGNGSASYYNTYDTDGRVLQSVTGPRGELVRGYGYHPTTANLLTSVTNALGEVLRYTHTNGLRVSSISHPSGLVTTNLYYTSGIHTGFLARRIDLGFRTNSFSYTNGNVFVQTNELGLVTTNLWDGLNRLSATHFPDGTYLSNRWDKLDLVGERDRMGFWTRYKFNAVRQLVAVTNANGAVTEYDYCGCGSPSQITQWNGTNALITTMDYNLAGQLTNVVFPDGYMLGYTYDDLERILTAMDGGNHLVEFGYNDFNQVADIKVGNGANQRHWALRQYDEYGRLTSRTDRNGVTETINSYDFLNRMLERYTTGGGSQSGTEYFDYGPRGLTNHTDALGKVTRFVRDELGRSMFETNANFEVLQFTYNPAGQLLALTDGNLNTTRWNYDTEGHVTNKADAANAEMFRYRYDSNGRMTNRWQAGGISTTFRHDAMGNLTNVDYPNSSDLMLRYDSLNRLTNLTDGVGTTAFSWTDGGLLASEDGPWSNDTVSYTNLNRLRTAMSVSTPSSAVNFSYAYDEYRRMTNLSSVAGSFSTEYADVWSGGSQMIPSLISELGLPGGSAITNEFDGLGRLLSTALRNSLGSELNSRAYQYNAGHQRTRQTFPAGNYVDYTYDDIGQLQTATGWESDTTTPRLHEQFGYAYDAGWNLNRRTNNALVQTFTVNHLNGLTNVARANTYTVAGNVSATPTSVTVKDNANSAVAATVYGDNSFARESVPLLNGNNTFTAIAENAAGMKDTNVINAYLPTPVTLYYDVRGNLTNDGRRVFFYDDENQLTAVVVSNAWLSEFAYDGLMRRRVRKEYTWASGAWLKTNEVRYICDELLVIQERDTNNVPLITYTRGNDMSGRLQGAGGIGGLFARTTHASLTVLSSAYYHADGNGNITALVNGSGNRVAQYHYDPYGNLLAASGPLAEANQYRFSSKEWHANAGLYYYGFRFYEPNLQRWLNQDPIEEEGGINLARFVRNNPINETDYFGLKPGDCYKTEWDAAIAALQDINSESIKLRQEYGGYIYKNKKGYTYDQKRLGRDGGKFPIPNEDYGKPVADYHTHGGPGPGDPKYYAGWEHFSALDRRSNMRRALIFNRDTWWSYLGTPSGRFKGWMNRDPFADEHDWGDLESMRPPRRCSE